MSINSETTVQVTNQLKSFDQIVPIPNVPVLNNSSSLMNNGNVVTTQHQSLPQTLPTYEEATALPMGMALETSTLISNENSVVTTQPQFQPTSLPHNQPPFDEAAVTETAQIQLLQEQEEDLKQKERQMRQDREVEQCCFVCDEAVNDCFCWMFFINYCCRPIGLFCQCLGECTESCLEGCGECISGCCESGCCDGDAVETSGSSADCADCDCSCFN